LKITERLILFLHEISFISVYEICSIIFTVYALNDRSIGGNLDIPIVVLIVYYIHVYFFTDKSNILNYKRRSLANFNKFFYFSLSVITFLGVIFVIYSYKSGLHYKLSIILSITIIIAFLGAKLWGNKLSFNFSKME
jgi:hypothetical protein